MLTELTHDDPPDPYAPVRPSARLLLLLLRAAFVDDGLGGPWLYVSRSATPGGAPVYVHTVTMTFAEWMTPHRMVMLTGDEVLAYVAEQQWHSITDPTTHEVRALAEHAVTLRRADLWAADPYNDSSALAVADALDDEQAERARAAARAARWQMAEKWLRQPAR